MTTQTKLKALLEERNITGYALSKGCGIASSIIYQIMNGKVYAYKGWRERISKSLGVPEEDIFIVDEEEK